MQTKKFTFFIKGVDSDVFYETEDNQFHCVNHLFHTKDKSLDTAMAQMDDELYNYSLTLCHNQGDYFTSEKDISEIPANIRIFLGASEVLSKASSDVSYINLLDDINSLNVASLTASKDYATVLYVPFDEIWITNLYKTLEQLCSLSSDISYSLAYKFENEKVTDKEWEVVLNIVKTLSKTTGNQFIITNC